MPFLLWRSLFALCLSFAFALSGAAQETTAKNKSGKAAPAKKRSGPVTSPTIHEDGSVTFQVKADNAKEVVLVGEMVQGRTALAQDENGIWSVTLKGLPTGVHGYGFVVDGMKTLDGGNMHLKPMRSPRTSILHLPGDHVYDFKDVPHGTVHQHGYHCKPIDRFRELIVYTPPGYETSQDRYPLLVLQHGHSDSFATWTQYGKAHWILDNLIAAGEAVPMIVVMLDGHPIPESYGNARSDENTQELKTDLMKVALPMVEKLYRVKGGSENRAIAGLSMGGLHSLTIGLSETGQFDWIGAFSAAPPAEEAAVKMIADVKKINADVRLLWIACGEQDFLLKENQRFVSQLEQAGVNHEWLLTKGNHSWPIWRGYLADFAPRLFQ